MNKSIIKNSGVLLISFQKLKKMIGLLKSSKFVKNRFVLVNKQFFADNSSDNFTGKGQKFCSVMNITSKAI